MISPVKSRRGMTLAELMVSVAMVAIMIVMAVSFVTLMSGHTRTSNENLSFQQDFAAVKAGVEGWISAAAGEELQLAQANPEYVLASISTGPTGSTQTLRFQNGALRGTLPGGKTFSIYGATIAGVTFELVDKAGDYLLFCTVNRANSQDSYTFCVDTRVGEAGGTQ